MSEPGNDEKWTDQTLRTSAEWALQRERARNVLAALGKSRADDDLSTARPGGPTYVTRERRVNPTRSGDIRGN
jgi:hypothetical protein